MRLFGLLGMLVGVVLMGLLGVKVLDGMSDGVQPGSRSSVDNLMTTVAVETTIPPA